MIARIFSSLRGGAADPALKKLRNRLLLVNLISLTLVIAIAFSIIYINFYSRAQNEIEKSLALIPRGVLENVMLSQQRIDPVETIIATAGGGIVVGSAITISGEPHIPVDYSKSFVANIMENGEIAVFSILELDNDDYAGAIETALMLGKPSGVVLISGHAWRYSLEQGASFSRPAALPPYQSSIVFLDVDDTYRRLGELALSLLVIGIVAVGAILLVSLLIANRAIRPVEESMARQRRFVADASHELKTPIAVIAANAEAAKGAVCETDNNMMIPADLAAHTDCGGEEAGKADVSRWIDNITDETNRMGSLVENLLTLAKAGERRADKASFDLVRAVCDEADRVEAFMFEKNISFNIDLMAPQETFMSVCSDREKVQAVLSILLENAVKYTPENGCASIAIGNGTGNKYDQDVMKGSKSNKHAFYIEVSNTGEYIPPEDLVRIFDRFFRADRSRSSETGGHGLGLSIAKETARNLGGELTALSIPRADGGAINTFTLYL